MSAPVTYDGKQMWRIDVERRQAAVLYVLADTPEEARADAEELAADVRAGEWDDVEDDLSVTPARSEPQPGSFVWTGGPDGRDLLWPPS